MTSSAGAGCSCSASSSSAASSARDRVRAQRRRPDRVPRGPGRRRGVHDARDAVDHHAGVPAPRARDRDRHLGRRVSALALAIGPVVGGFLTQNVSWRAIFFINPPIARRRGRRDAVRRARVPRRDGVQDDRLRRHRRADGRLTALDARARRGQQLGLGLDRESIALLVTARDPARRRSS